jgi:lipid-binding SYLF domain-containing protein
MLKARAIAGVLVIALVVMTPLNTRPVGAASAAAIDRDATATLAKLYAAIPEARTLERHARAVLVFPTIVKAGFMFGAPYGEGVLRRRGKTTAHYNSIAASDGYEAGLQAFGYALFFMRDSALQTLDQTGGFEVGVGPSVVVLDAGTAKSLSTTTMQSDIYAFTFDRTGRMAGVGIQGSKISRIER